jgi:Trypsin-co-occurring domain 1
MTSPTTGLKGALADAAGHERHGARCREGVPLRPMAQTLITRLRELTERPDELGIEFGLKMTMEAGTTPPGRGALG